MRFEISEHHGTKTINASSCTFTCEPVAEICTDCGRVVLKAMRPHPQVGTVKMMECDSSSFAKYVRARIEELEKREESELADRAAKCAAWDCVVGMLGINLPNT